MGVSRRFFTSGSLASILSSTGASMAFGQSGSGTQSAAPELPKCPGMRETIDGWKVTAGAARFSLESDEANRAQFRFRDINPNCLISCT